MASEDQDRTVPVSVPPDVADWIDERAAERDEDREAVCRRLLAAVHEASELDEEAFDPVVRDDLEDLGGRLEAQREEFVDLVEDVRSRLIQVKREADGKAPADHDHDDLADADALASLETDLEALEGELAALEETVESGFDNFEEVLEHLLDETGDLDARTRRLAEAVLDFRDQRDAMAARQRRRAEADALQLAANRLGIRTATCDGCETSVDIALLSEPACPHCGSSVADVAEKESLFGSPRLVTGSPPALEGRVDATADRDGVAFEAMADAAEDDSDDPSNRRPEVSR